MQFSKELPQICQVSDAFAPINYPEAKKQIMLLFINEILSRFPLITPAIAIERITVPGRSRYPCTFRDLLPFFLETVSAEIYAVEKGQQVMPNLMSEWMAIYPASSSAEEQVEHLILHALCALQNQLHLHSTPTIPPHILNLKISSITKLIDEDCTAAVREEYHMAVWAFLLIFCNAPFTRAYLSSSAVPVPSLGYLESVIGHRPAHIFTRQVSNLKKLWSQVPIPWSNHYFQDRVFALCQWQGLLHGRQVDEEKKKVSDNIADLLVTALQDIQGVKGFYRYFLYQMYFSNKSNEELILMEAVKQNYSALLSLPVKMAILAHVQDYD